MKREQTIGADLYLTGIYPEDCPIHKARPCLLCARTITQAGIRNVVLRVGEEADQYVVVRYWSGVNSNGGTGC